jgi:hypothetical protein
MLRRLGLAWLGLAASLMPRLENVTYIPGLYGWAVVIKERCMEVF